MEGKAQCEESFFALNRANYSMRFDASTSVATPPNEITRYFWTIYPLPPYTGAQAIFQPITTGPVLNHQFAQSLGSTYYVCVDVEATGDLSCLEQFAHTETCLQVAPTP